MQRLTLTMIAALVFAGSAFAGTQDPAPKARVAPKVAPAAPATPAPPATKAYAMAWSSNSGGSYLGIDITEVTSDRVAALKLKEERGVEITMVDRDAPAGKAGLKEHDVILELNGTRIEGEEQLRRMLRETPAGRKITLGISRDGQPMQIEATLAAREGAMVSRRSIPRIHMEAPEVMIPAMPDIQMPQFEVMVRSYSRRTGMMVDNLTPQLGEFFGVKSGQGVLVRSVEKGSAAESAGLKAGDVIVKVDNESIDDRNDWNRIMRKKGGKISLGIVRDKHEQTLTVTLPEVRSPEEGRFFEFDGESDFEFQPQTVDIERLERTMRQLHHEFEINAPRIAEHQARIQKTMVEQQARIAEKLAAAQAKIEKSMQTQHEKLQLQEQQIRQKLEETARTSRRI